MRPSKLGDKCPIWVTSGAVAQERPSGRDQLFSTDGLRKNMAVKPLPFVVLDARHYLRVLLIMQIAPAITALLASLLELIDFLPYPQRAWVGTVCRQPLESREA